jgi:hypothetical protein
MLRTSFSVIASEAKQSFVILSAIKKDEIASADFVSLAMTGVSRH